MGGVATDFTYFYGGLRKTKTSGGVTKNYYYDGDRLIAEKWSTGAYLLYHYDQNGMVYSISYSSTGSGYSKYYLIKNLHGDVVQLRDVNNSLVANYEYDAWGNLISVKNASGATITSGIAIINPIRYRGYYYDNETGFYYLKSRYYDPANSRFISTDSRIDLDYGTVNLNLFAYCGSDPVNRVDDGGHFWHLIIGGVVGAVVGAVTTAISGGDLTDVLIATAAGAGSGVLAASGVGLVAEALGSAAIAMTSNALQQVNHIVKDDTGATKFDVVDMIADGVVGLACGYFGGNGASHGNTAGINSSWKQLIKKGVTNPQARQYFYKTARRAGEVFVLSALNNSLEYNTLGSLVLSLKNRIRNMVQ